MLMIFKCTAFEALLYSNNIMPIIDTLFPQISIVWVLTEVYLLICLCSVLSSQPQKDDRFEISTKQNHITQKLQKLITL